MRRTRTGFTGIDPPDPQDSFDTPYNAYRFNAKRFDPETGSYDMGFRDYSPGLNQFLTRDNYNGALADMGLTTDPYTGNRYAYGAGNPYNNIELDGHLECEGPDGYDCGKAEYEGYDTSGASFAVKNKHDAVVQDSVPLIREKMKELGITGTITVDLNAEGKAANTIPGADREGKGNDGIADIILWSEHNVYIWEVKSKGGKAKINGNWMLNTELGPIQEARYVTKLQEKLDAEGKDITVQRGFGFATGSTVFKNELFRTFSGKDDTPDEGVRYYVHDDRPRRPAPQPQEQENPAPAPADGCGGTGIVAYGPCLPNVVPLPGRNGLPFPKIFELPFPVPVPA